LTRPHGEGSPVGNARSRALFDGALVARERRLMGSFARVRDAWPALNRPLAPQGG
jgi:hypothetical protein